MVELPHHLFMRQDESPDPQFYALPRLVNHIDDATIAALTDFYAEAIPPRAAVLDLMSSWVSHLPGDLELARVAGLGLNAEELAANPRLDERVVHDLNASPALPFADASFDVVLNAVSIQYLTRPVEVFREVARVLRPGGLSIVAMSHRCFPTKAVRAFHVPGSEPRFRIVKRYHELASGFETIATHDRSPERADPLWVVTASRAAAASSRD